MGADGLGEVWDGVAAEGATMSARELVELAGTLAADDRFDEARRSLEQAFVEFRAAGAVRPAARVAAQLSELHGGPLGGNDVMARGWIQRGRRLLEGSDPCVEWGYLELARLACDRPDIDDLARSAARALEIARQFDDVGLEVRALADSGLALVTQGRVGEGLARLDEVLAMLSAGEVRDVHIVSTSLCSVLASCDRAGDVDRAIASIRVAEAAILRPLDGRPRVLSTHCKVVLGSVLCSAGRWSEGEATLLEAIGAEASVSVNHRTAAIARLAELRVHQGRIDEAADLLAGIEDSVHAAEPLAMVHLSRGHVDLAAAVLRDAIRRMVNDVLRGAALLALLVDAELARADVSAARQASDLLASMAVAVDVAAVAALADAVAGRIALSSGDPAAALAAFDRALDRLTDAPSTVLSARLRLDIAECQVALGDRARGDRIGAGRPRCRGSSAALDARRPGGGHVADARCDAAAAVACRRRDRGSHRARARGPRRHPARRQQC